MTDAATHSDETMRAKINAETAKMPWSELARYFAKGIVIRLEPGVDLVEVALAMSQDRTEWLKPLTEQGLLRRATDDDARQWVQDSSEFWAVVVAPWLVVQPLSDCTTRP